VTKARKAAPIKVKRVVPETGEIIEQTVGPNHFKPKKAKLVTADFRAKVLAGDRPGLIFPGSEDCPFKVGQEVGLTFNVSIVVNRVTKTKGGDHRCKYAVRDFRETLMRRTPPMFEPPETDQFGYPIKPTKEAIAAATIDGNYTQDPSQAVPSGAPEVDVEYRRVLGMRKRKRDADNEPTEAVRRKRERAVRDKLRETMRGLTPQGQAALLARIELDLEQAHEDASAEVV
jgi:hypothetical protein